METLTEPKNTIIKQYQFLLGTEGINLEFTDVQQKKISKHIL